MTVTIVGQAPCRQHGRARAFHPRTRSGRFIAEVAGTHDIATLGKPRNLLGSWPGCEGKGDQFPMPVARAAARRMRLRGSIVLLVGKRVALAFGVKASYFEPVQLRGRTAYVVPHPSGINTWWNSAANRRRARRFFARLSGAC